MYNNNYTCCEIEDKIENVGVNAVYKCESRII